MDRNTKKRRRTTAWSREISLISLDAKNYHLLSKFGNQLAHTGQNCPSLSCFETEVLGAKVSLLLRTGFGGKNKKRICVCIYLKRI